MTEIYKTFIFNQIIILASIFFFAQLCTAMQFGKYSDKHGRRPVLLLGLIGNSISACSFGLSKSIWWAMGSRAFCGFINGKQKKKKTDSLRCYIITCMEKLIIYI